MLPPGAPRAIAWGIIIGAESPDFDYVIRLAKGSVSYLKNHRGPTHGLVILPVHAAIIAAVLRLVWPEVPFWSLFGWTLAGCLSHVLFDFTNDYGTQGLWPFSRRWIAMDFIPIIDVWVLGLIGAGWFVEDFLWIGHRRLVFTVVWAAVAVYLWIRFSLRQKAAALVAARFDAADACGSRVPCGPGWREERLTVHPTLLSLNAWRYVLEKPGEYLVGMVWVRQRKVGEPQRARNDYDKIVLASLKSQVVTIFSQWVRRPRVEVTREGSLFKVRWTEMRYEVDGFGPFTAYAWLDDELKLVDEGLGSKQPPQTDKATLRSRLAKEMGREES